MKLALGAAQFGLDYGVTNTEGKVNKEQVKKILSFAKSIGIKKIDTATSYGESELVLGQSDISEFDIITKVPSIDSVTKKIDELVDDSLRRLNINNLYALMFHDENDVLKNSNEHFKSLIGLKRDKIVNKIGASFYSPEKALVAIETGAIDIIQIPASVLDNRFEAFGVYQAALNNNVEIHVRSLFLQGLLAVNASLRPEKFKLHPDLLRFDDVSQGLGLTPIETALMYVSHNKNISFGVIGCTSSKQLEQIFESYRKVNQLGDIKIPNINSSDDFLLNPNLWT